MRLYMLNDLVSRYNIFKELGCSKSNISVQPECICHITTPQGNYMVVGENLKEDSINQLVILSENLDQAIRHIALPLPPSTVLFHESGHLVVGMADNKTASHDPP